MHAEEFPTPEQDQVLDEILNSAGQISEAEIRARMASAGFAKHHADDVVTAVEWIMDDSHRRLDLGMG